MIFVIRKKHGVYAGLFVLFLSAFALILWKGALPAQPVFSPDLQRPSVVIIDPGHGGEDGGAVAADGTTESGINLAISLRLEKVLRFLGHETQMTRREDISVYTQGAETLREKKVSDLKNRVEQINAAENACLISIHQNSMPSVPSVHGAQTFHSQTEGSAQMAEPIQDALNAFVNQGNEKSYKQISDSIYLMKHVTCPAALVECGFLSNSNEVKQLQSSGYQNALAVSIAAGYQRYLANGGTE